MAYKRNVVGNVKSDQLRYTFSVRKDKTTGNLVKSSTLDVITTKGGNLVQPLWIASATVYLGAPVPTGPADEFLEYTLEETPDVKKG
jgi:hypothetical protein